MNSSPTPVHAALARLKALHPKLIDLNLERMERVCAALGRPQDRLAPIVHVAGTNGKGSTIALLRAMCEAAGKRVHVYASPHLVQFHERIRLAGALIEDAKLIDVLNRVEAANGGAPLTFFEATTAAAFVAFAEVPADILLLEVGLGGVLDATNIIPPPVLSLITPIDYDHQNFLGDTLTLIAREKAGIIKPGVPVASAEQAPEARRVIEGAALRAGVRAKFAGEAFEAWAESGRLVFRDADTLFDLPLPRLSGGHQIANAALALKAAQALGLDEAAMSGGLEAVSWPGRLQPLTRGPLPGLLRHPESRIILDGAHNPHGARALADYLYDETRRTGLKAHLIVGQLSTKDPEGFFEAFAGMEVGICCVSFSGEAALAPEVLAEVASRHGIAATTATNINAALAGIGPEPHIVVIAGSLYLIGDILGLSPETWPR